MKYLIVILCLITFSSCSTRQINGREQTFTEYVILNKYSDYEGNTKQDWDNQPSENFPGLRLIKWFGAEEIDMQRFITIEEYNNLNDNLKEKYKLIYLDPETNCIPYGYQLE